MFVGGAVGGSNRTALTEDEVLKWQDECILEYPGDTDVVRSLIEQSYVSVLPSYRVGMPGTVLETAAINASEVNRAGGASRRRMEELFSEVLVVKAYLVCLS